MNAKWNQVDSALEKLPVVCIYNLIENGVKFLSISALIRQTLLSMGWVNYYVIVVESCRLDSGVTASVSLITLNSGRLVQVTPA